MIQFDCNVRLYCITTIYANANVAIELIEFIIQMAEHKKKMIMVIIIICNGSPGE